VGRSSARGLPRPQAGRAAAIRDAVRSPAAGTASAAVTQAHAASSPSQANGLGRQAAARIESRRGGGIPLPEADRAFFEPRLGRPLAGVRLHADAEAAELSAGMDARAFTTGDDVFFGVGEYRPDSASGRHLLAHELAHVLQQRAGDAPIRRQTIDASCADRAAIVTAAWNTARDDLLPAALGMLKLVREVSDRQLGGELAQTQRTIIENSFGDVGFVSGISRLGDLIGRFERLAAAFATGRTLKCSPSGSTSAECSNYEACVVEGNDTDIFLNESFFDVSKNAERRGITLIHEMAHSALHAEHGSSGDTAVFDCGTILETSYEQARDNAYSYEMLAACASGLLQPAGVTGQVPPKAAATDSAGASGLSVGASAGVGFGSSAGVDSDTARFVGSISGRYTFGLGEFMVFSPGIGFGLLYLSPSAADPQHVAAVTSEFAGRFHLPLAGMFVDLGAGGYAGVDIGQYTEQVEATAGLSAFTGVGWQWKALEIGPEFRAQLPLTEGNEPGMIVMGRFQVHTP
jgi:hypothetical protein